MKFSMDFITNSSLHDWLTYCITLFESIHLNRVSSVLKKGSYPKVSRKCLFCSYHGNAELSPDKISKYCHSKITKYGILVWQTTVVAASQSIDFTEVDI